MNYALFFWKCPIIGNSIRFDYIIKRIELLIIGQIKQ